MLKPDSSPSALIGIVKSRGFLIGCVIVLTAWVILLRGHSLGHPVWNVDETIHAAVAEVLLDGGTLYRDAIDQRSPLTYYATAAVFAISGSSLVALRYLTMALIIAAAWLLGRTVARTSGVATGVGAAGIFVAFANYLLFTGDTFAYHTEWFVVFFTAAAAWCFLGGNNALPSLVRCLATGIFLGLAVMSKQSALLDIAPGVVALIALGWDRSLAWRSVLSRIAALLGGVALATLLLVLPSLISGAGGDLLYYTWTYNVSVYGAEYSFAEKIASGIPFIELVWKTYPLLLILGVISALILLVRIAQLTPSEAIRNVRHGEVYLIVWLVTSLGGAMAGGRGFDHYFFPVLAPLAWLCAWAPGTLVNLALLKSTRPVWVKGIAALTLLGATFSFVVIPLEARKTPPPPGDPAYRISAWMKDQSTRADRIFVWGFNPDIYHYTERLPASRFLYCTFQTGLIPWTNTDPFVDTAYAIVPGAMDTLLDDLERNPPRFFIDSSVGPHRFFGKYPVRNFQQLHDWLHAHYAEAEGARFSGQGFRVYVRSDEAIEQVATTLRPDPNAAIGLDGHDRISGGLNHVRVDFHGTPDAKATGLGLMRDGEVIAAVRLLPSGPINIKVPVIVGEDTDTVDFQPIVQLDGGDWVAGSMQTGQVASMEITPQQAEDFSVPLLSNRVEAVGLRAFFGARSEQIDGQRVFSIHAPALLSYELAARVDFLSGKLGLPPGAYSTDNPAPSDGAEFIIRHVPQIGPAVEVFRRSLNPRINGGDQGHQGFRVQLVATEPGDVIELEITPGPSGVASSDWTYWADLLFETSL